MSTISVLVWQTRLETLLLTAQGDFNDVTNPEFVAEFGVLFDAISNGDSSFVAQALSRMDQTRRVLSNNDSRIDYLEFFIQLQNEVNRRTCELGLPQILTRPIKGDLQGQALRCIDGQEQLVSLQTANTADYNDVQISFDGSTMVAAGSGSRSRAAVQFADGIQLDRECSETFVAGRIPETYPGIQIYSRVILNKRGACSDATNDPTDWELQQSALIDATITSVHVNNDGTEIIAYDLYENVVYVLRSNGCGVSSGNQMRPQWNLIQKIVLEQDLDGIQDYAICASMHASESHNTIVVSNKNLTSNTVKVYVLIRAAACDQVNGLLNRTSVGQTQFRLVQTLLDQDVKYQEVTLSRDGQTLLLEFGSNEPIVPGEPAATNIEFGYTGMRIYHWQPKLNNSGDCEFALRQTIVYDDVATNYVPNTFPAEYTDCTKGRTVHLFFAGRNDNRIIRLISRRTLAIGREFPVPRQPWELNVAEAGLFQVFDREDLLVDICGNELASAEQGIVNTTSGTTIRRGVFAEFVAQPIQQLFGCIFKNQRTEMLYTHPVNKGIFMTWCDFQKELQLYCETDQGNWVMVPPSKYPYGWLSTTAGDEALGYRGYMALNQDAECEELRSVCMPAVAQYAGRFIFRTMNTDGSDGFATENVFRGNGFFNGNDNAPVDLGNGAYYDPSDSFVISQINQPDRPFLAQFPCPKAPDAADPGLSFTRTGNVDELPGMPAIPDPIPFPLQFNVWQRWPQGQDNFPPCRTGYFKLSKVDPFVNVGCNVTAEFVLTPKFYMFDPTSEEDEPNPNVDPRWIFSRAIAPVYIGLSTLCFELQCAGKDCKCDGDQFPFYYKTVPAEMCQ